MRYRVAAIILLASAALCVVGLFSYSRNVKVDRITSWSESLGLGGTKLRLKDSGRYRSLDWGDLPPYHWVTGSWRAQGIYIYLVPDSPRAPIQTYEVVEKFGCRFLRRPGMDVPLDLFPSGITPADLSIEDSNCRRVVQEQNERGRVHRH